MSKKEKFTLPGFMREPMDDEQFLFLYQVANAAASGTYQTSAPSDVKFSTEEIDGDPTVYQFTDNPLNRAMLAANRQGLPVEVTQSFCWRYISLGDVVRQADRFPRHIVRNDDAEITELSESLLRAIARAKLRKSGKYDIDRLAADADAIERELDGK